MSQLNAVNKVKLINMKKLLFLFLFIWFGEANAQTYVLIPDANFAAYLRGIIPAAMKGDSLDTSNILVTTITDSIDVSNHTTLSNLFGIQYFTSLTYLECNSCSLVSIPSLPNTLKYLSCAQNYLTNLPVLPASLTYLNCSLNSLTTLSVSGTSLTYLACASNSLTNISSLPNSLTYLICAQNQLTNLPTLPDSLTYLYCESNYLINLPTLPGSLQSIYCAHNSLTDLPSLPHSLSYLDCSYNSLTNISALDTMLNYLDCSFNSITSLPTLNSSLRYLNCSYNSLTSIPTLPSLQHLYCNNNNIACFPKFPSSIYPAYYNVVFHSWIYSISINNNPFDCLPNYLPSAMDPVTLAYPLCAAGNTNGCPDATGINQQEFNNIIVTVIPNPATTQFSLILPIATATYTLYNMQGSMQREGKITGTEAEINVADLPRGVYILKVLTDKQIITKKVVLQ